MATTHSQRGDTSKYSLVSHFCPDEAPHHFLKVDHDYVEGDIEYPFEETGGVGDENKIRGNWSGSMDYYLSVFGFTFAVGNVSD